MYVVLPIQTIGAMVARVLLCYANELFVVHCQFFGMVAKLSLR